MQHNYQWLLAILASLILAEHHFVSQVLSAEKEEEEIKQMVASLVSHNKEPPRKRSAQDKYVLPSGFDHEENLRVITVRDAVLRRGVVAFPSLINALDDARYSHTEIDDDNGSVQHWHVREVCFYAMQAQVEVYSHFARPSEEVNLVQPMWLPVPFMSPAFWPPGAKGYMEKWWAPRQSMTLCELQREAVEWAIEYEQGKGFWNEEEKTLVLGWYKPLQARLMSSEKAISVDWQGRFVEEEILKPKDADSERWAELMSEKEKTMKRIFRDK